MGYSRYVGRVGALAVALGVGVAVTSTPGVAWGDDSTTARGSSAPGAPAYGTVTIAPDGTFHYTPTQTGRLCAGLTPNIDETDTFTVAVAVTDEDGNQVTTTIANIPVSPAALTVNGESNTPITVGNSPSDVAISPHGSLAYITDGSNTVSVIDTATNTVIGDPIHVGDGPQGVAVSPDGTRAYITKQFDDTVSVISIGPSILKL